MQPYRIDFHRSEGWCRYKALKHTRNRGWWKDCGTHELARKLVALGLPDGPVETYDERGVKCLTFKSLYWMADYDITENNAGITYFKHGVGLFGEDED